MIKAENLTKIYQLDKKKLVILDNISLEIPFGKSISIVGESGVGKSTLLHILGTIDRPTSGNILFNDQNIANLSDRKLAKFRNKHIGFVFQFHHLLPEFSALENVMIPYLVFERDRKKAFQEAERLLTEVGLKDRMKHRPSELSGGEQQRVAIARALINQPEVIFADEPTGNLDEKTSEMVHGLLLELQRKYNATLVVVTHNERLARQFDLQLCLTRGQVKYLDT